ncbi:MAG: metal-sulfur cluster assembly factor [Gemmatimonadales bacterium]
MDLESGDGLTARVYRQLARVIDPELGMDIVKLGLIYGVDIQTDRVLVTMTMTTRGCPLEGALVEGVRRAVNELPDIRSVQVKVTWEPPWDPGMIRGDTIRTSTDNIGEEDR